MKDKKNIDSDNKNQKVNKRGRLFKVPNRFIARTPQQNTKNKLAVLQLCTLVAFAYLVIRLVNISLQDGERYKQTVLSQQTYNNTTLPYRRGSIVDRNGTTLAHSVQVYNLILDAKEMNLEPEKIEYTLTILNQCFGTDTAELRTYIRENPNSAYKIVVKQLTFEQVRQYQELVEASRGTDFEMCENGVWFEDDYTREYPYGSLAADVIGFTTKDGIGQYGLEEYYNDILSGTNGRAYGYRTEGNGMEYTVIPATNGYTLVTSIDVYIQEICEKNIEAYNLEHANEFREGELGSDNTAVIIMDIDTGEILAMASYPFFDLNNPTDLSAYYTPEEIAFMQEEGTLETTAAAIWKNFCISESYEPGSVNKTYACAAALDAGAIHDGDTFYCYGYLTFGEGSRAVTIRCHNRYGDGQLTVMGAIEQSCNVALMEIGQKLGADRMLTYLHNFNFGLKTNIDLAGEMRTDTLVFNADTMGVTELATSTFGQGYNVTMIQNITAFCSVINGGYYYKPHVVKQIVDDSGAVIQNIEPFLLRQTISESVSATMREYCIGVVREGTGVNARPAGYMIGGKTGTAEHSGDGKVDYTVSFMGFAPADDPQIAIYVVIDRPNAASQESGTRYACLLCRSILTDVLPYLNIYMTEELSDKERQELEERGAKILEEAQEALNASDESVSENQVEGDGTGEESQDPEVEVIDLEIPAQPQVIIDPNTGYAIDPLNGEYLDPVTGEPINGNSSIYQDSDGNNIDSNGL